MTLRSYAALIASLVLTLAACEGDKPAAPPATPDAGAPKAAKPDMPAAPADAAPDAAPAVPAAKKTPPPDSKFGGGINQTPSAIIPSKDLADGKEAPAWKSRVLKTTRLFKARGQASVIASIPAQSRAVLLDNSTTCDVPRKDEPLDFILVDIDKGKEIARFVQFIHAIPALSALYVEQVTREQRATVYVDLLDGAVIDWLKALSTVKVDVLGEGNAAWITVTRADGRVAVARLADNKRPVPTPPPKKKSKEPSPEPPAPLAEPTLVTSFVPDALWHTEAAVTAAQAPEAPEDCVVERLGAGKDAPECLLKADALAGYVHMHWLRGYGVFEDKNNGWTLLIDLATGAKINPVPGECVGASLVTVSRVDQEPRLLFQCSGERSEATYALWAPEQSFIVRDSSALLFKEPVFRDGLITVGVGAGRKGAPKGAYILDGLRGKMYRSFLNEDLDPARSPLAPFIYDLDDAVFDADYARLDFAASDVQLLTRWRCEERFVQLFNSERILAFGCIQDPPPAEGKRAIRDVLVLDLKTWTKLSTKLIPTKLDGDTLYLTEAKQVGDDLKPCDTATIHAAKL
jgi:hypothetical protein